VKVPVLDVDKKKINILPSIEKPKTKDEEEEARMKRYQMGSVCGGNKE
jgi:hypothetical protein